MRSRLLNSLKARFFPKPRRARSWPEEPLDLATDSGGGFYPGQLGAELQPGYTLTRKLGWGMHSSVWLAQDAK